MFEKTEKKLNLFLNAGRNEGKISGGLDEKMHEKLQHCDALLVFKKGGSLEIIETKLISKELVISFGVNAVLIVLLLTKIGGIW